MECVDFKSFKLLVKATPGVLRTDLVATLKKSHSGTGKGAEESD